MKHEAFSAKLSLRVPGFRACLQASSLSRSSLANVLANVIAAARNASSSWVYTIIPNRYFRFSAASIGTAPRWGFSASRYAPKREYTRWHARLFTWARKRSSPRIGRPLGSSSRLRGTLYVLLYAVPRWKYADSIKNRVLISCALVIKSH
jgi:hypothetical protein